MIHDSTKHQEVIQAVLIGGDGKVKTIRQGGDRPRVLVGIPTPQKQEKKNEHKK